MLVAVVHVADRKNRPGPWPQCRELRSCAFLANSHGEAPFWPGMSRFVNYEIP
jgi:hypothetical protein